MISLRQKIRVLVWYEAHGSLEAVFDERLLQRIQDNFYDNEYHPVLNLIYDQVYEAN